MKTAKGRDPDEPIQLCTFAVGQELFALDIMRIREIVRPLPVTAVPRAPVGMRGVFNLRGRILPLYDLGQRVGTGTSGAARDERGVRFFIVTLEGRLLALEVDEVFDVVEVRRKELRPASSVFAGDAATYFAGVMRLEDKLVLLLNLHRLLAGTERVDLAGLQAHVDAGGELGADGVAALQSPGGSGGAR